MSQTLYLFLACGAVLFAIVFAIPRIVVGRAFGIRRAPIAPLAFLLVAAFLVRAAYRDEPLGQVAAGLAGLGLLGIALSRAHIKLLASHLPDTPVPLLLTVTALGAGAGLLAAGLNDRVYDALPEVASAVAGVGLLSWSLAVASERPPIRWKNLKNFKPASPYRSTRGEWRPGPPPDAADET